MKENGKIYDSFSGPLDEDMIKAQQVGYYACITHIDHQIGRLLQALEAQGVLDNTVIIFTSDHGEMLSDHCLNRKSVPYQGSIHIPMIVWGPESLIGKCRRTDERLVEFRDIMPTFMNIAGHHISNIDGLDMLGKAKHEYLHGEHYEESDKRANQFIVTREDKYTWFPKTGKRAVFSFKIRPI